MISGVLIQVGLRFHGGEVRKGDRPMPETEHVNVVGFFKSKITGEVRFK